MATTEEKLKTAQEALASVRNALTGMLVLLQKGNTAFVRRMIAHMVTRIDDVQKEIK